MENLPERLNHFRASLLGKAWVLYHANNWPREMEPEDIVSATFVRALERLSQFRGSTDQELGGWLFAIFHSRVSEQLDYFQAQCRNGNRVQSIDEFMNESHARMECLLVSDLPSPSTPIRSQDQLEYVYRNIPRLSPAPRKILLMRYSEKMEIPAIAAALKISEANALRRLVKATQKLAHLMREEQSR